MSFFKGNLYTSIYFDFISLIQQKSGFSFMNCLFVLIVKTSKKVNVMLFNLDVFYENFKDIQILQYLNIC